MTARLPIALALAAALVACAGAPRADAPAVPADDNLNAVLWIQHAQEYALSTLTVFNAAGRQLEPALADGDWDAIDPAERRRPARGLPPAIIVDIDETILDNSDYQAGLILQGLEYDPATWADWVEEARARPVPGAVAFLQRADALGVTVYYITNREHRQEAATLRNLREAGFPVREGAPVHLGLGMDIDGCTDEGQNKVCRRQWVADRHRVLMQFGDQLSDFTGIGDNAPVTRDAAAAVAGDWFGERWFMLPNPTYGYWEGALFGDRWALPPEQRRAIKRRALRTD
ncbi:MAG: 5'-nucleotidase, lipoprotein e(P4) family [Lysobacteraceae bacterium]